jgi:hypothetical protein
VAWHERHFNELATSFLDGTPKLLLLVTYTLFENAEAAFSVVILDFTSGSESGRVDYAIGKNMVAMKSLMQIKMEIL